MLTPEAMLMSVDHVADRHHVDAHGLCTTEGHDSVCGPCCGQGPCRCLCSVLPLESMVTSVVHVTTKSYVDVHCSCYHQRPWEWIGSVRPPRVMVMSVVHATMDRVRVCVVLLPEAMLISMAHTTTKGHIGLYILPSVG